MDPRLCVIAPYEGLGNLARQVAEEMGEKVEVVVCEMDSVVEVARQLEKSGADAIISRGGTAALLREKLEVPVISITFTAFDVLRGVQAAKRYGTDIGFFIFGARMSGLEELEEAITVRIKQYTVNDIREKSFGSLLELAKSEGIRVVVGGIVAVSLAERNGMKGVLIQSSKDSIMQAIASAKNVALVRRKEKSRARELQAILDYTSEGIIAIDEHGRVAVFNPAAEKIFGIKEQEVIGQPVQEAVPNSRLHVVLKTGQAEVGQLQRVGEVRIVTNRIPIEVDGKVTGVVAHFQDVTKIQELEGKIRKELHQKGLVAKFNFHDIVGESSVLRRTVRLAQTFGGTDFTVLISGESGTGKELFAQSMHNISRRKEGPFVAVNCAAIPVNLLESELFGYEDGAFTGARKGGKAGLFELAHGGTIFLDEVSEIPPDLQARLLRVLQEKEVMRIGGNRVIPVDTRIIAATNRQIEKMVEAGEFRADLFYRLNVLHLRVPPLREHLEDLPLLVEHILAQLEPAVGRRLQDVIPGRLPAWQKYRWPGNVRELDNAVKRLAVIVNDTELYRENSLELLTDAGQDGQVGVGKGEARASIVTFFENTLRSDPAAVRVLARRRRRMVGEVADFEAKFLRQVVEQCAGNRSEAARVLGIGRTTLWRRLKAADSRRFE